MAEEEALETGREPVNDIYERPPKLPAPLSVTLRELQETYVNPGLGSGHNYIEFKPWTTWSRFFNFGGVNVHVALFDRLPGAEQGSGANELDFRLTPFHPTLITYGRSLITRRLHVSSKTGNCGKVEAALVIH